MKNLTLNGVLLTSMVIIHPLISKSQISEVQHNNSNKSMETLGNDNRNFKIIDLKLNKSEKNLNAFGEYQTVQGAKNWSNNNSTIINNQQDDTQLKSQANKSVINVAIDNFQKDLVMTNETKRVSISSVSPPSVLKMIAKNVRKMVTELESSHFIPKTSTLTLTSVKGMLFLNDKELSQEESIFYGSIMSSFHIHKITRDLKGNIAIE